jgi:hypothetical protein
MYRVTKTAMLILLLASEAGRKYPISEALPYLRFAIKCTKPRTNAIINSLRQILRQNIPTLTALVVILEYPCAVVGDQLSQ